MFSSGFVQNGARVYITSRKASECEKVAADLSAKGPGKCFALAEDLATLAGIASFARRLKAAGEDKVHVLINNSGISWGQPMMEFQEKGWDQVFALNVKSVFYMTREMLPFLEKSATKENPAHVINIGSIAGITGQAVPTYSYDASKAAVHHLTKKLASDLAPSHICVNAIAPGFVPSKMSSQLLTYADKATIEKNIPMGRLGDPADMAGAALFLSSRASAWITGAILVADGGLSSQPSKFNLDSHL